jgi:Heterokaryon incompatibility protein (HET)
MLCGTCSHVLSLSTWRRLSGSNEARKTIDHHPGRAEVQSAATEGCELCAATLRWLDLCSGGSHVRIRGWTDAETHEDLLNSMSLEICLGDGTVQDRTLSLERFVQRSKFNWAKLGRVRMLLTSMLLADRSSSVVSLTRPQSSIEVSRKGLELGSAWDSHREITIMQRWVQICEEEHPECARPPNLDLPGRLVEISDEGHALKIVDVELSDGTPYTALSYCWGGDMSLMLMAVNEKALRSGFRVKELATTMQDAVRLTWKFGLRHIWIDCLCVMQDNQSDWLHETSRMGSIYGGATFCISPVSAANASEGFLKTRPASMAYLPSGSGSDIGLQTRPVYFRLQTRSWSKFKDQPSQKRGWCFQERLLSRRTLHITTEQILFECRHLADGEDGKKRESIPFDWRRRFFGLHWENPSATALETAENLEHRSWFNLIEEYSDTRFTIESDRLPALAALARRFDERFHDEYLAGLWRSHLHAGLLWSVSHDRISIEAPLDPSVVLSKSSDQILRSDSAQLEFGGSALMRRALYAAFAYLTHLWKTRLRMSIFWPSSRSQTTEDALDHSTGAQQTRSWHRALWTPTSAPSWSWAAVGKPVSWKFYSDGVFKDQELHGFGSFKLLAKILEVETSPSSPDPYGPVAAGNIRLKAFYASYNRPSGESPWDSKEAFADDPKTLPARGAEIDGPPHLCSPSELSPSCHCDAADMDLVSYLRKHEVCEIIGIAIESDMDSTFDTVYNSYALLVERVPNSPPNTYRRVGVIRLYASIFAWTRTCTITLI